MKNLLAIVLLSLFIINLANAQNVAINTDGTNANSDAILHLKSTSKGLLIPSMTSSQRTSISNVSNGLMVYDTQTNSFWYRDSGTWKELITEDDIDNTMIEDSDGNTKIQVEEGNDDDEIRFDIDGAEHLVFKENNNGILMMEITSGTGFNTFLGEDAGLNNNHNNFDGFSNTFLGYSAGKSMSSGSYNLFSGSSAGLNFTSGDNNVMVGASAGDAISSGDFNTMIGASAGGSQTSGQRNTYLGASAGNFRPSGDHNTFIGYYAGRNASSSGSNNVYIGYQVGTQSGNSDELMIDNSSTSSPLIHGRFDDDELEFNGKVGISRNPGTNALEVNGSASKSSAGDWIANSDARLKKNITNLDSDQILSKLLQLQGVTYEWNDTKTGNDRPEGIQYGFTAQNIQEVYPELVTEDNLGYLQTAYGTYDAMYVEAIRELLNKIELLENRIDQLEEQHQSTVSK